jgi:hypothetical protein
LGPAANKSVSLASSFKVEQRVCQTSPFECIDSRFLGSFEGDGSAEEEEDEEEEAGWSGTTTTP